MKKFAMEKEPCLKTDSKKAAVVCQKNRAVSANSCSRMSGPDGGWAWCVAGACCAINFIMAGLGRMSGILYVAFIDLYRTDRKGASAPFSVRSSTRNLLGPVVGILGQKYGVRSVTIMGGVIGTLSAASCFFANDITWITLLWGGVNGMGCALTVTLPQVTIGQYFEKHRTTASGLAFSGGCVGSFLFPVLLEQMLQAYGMQGSFLIIAAIIAHCIPAAMILKKPPWLRHGGHKPPAGSVSTDIVHETPAQKKAKFSEGSEVKHYNGNDFTPTKNGFKDESCPDVQFLRENNAMVMTMLTSEPMSEVRASLEVNRNQQVPELEAHLTHQMEAMYAVFEKSKNKSMFQKNLQIEGLKRTLFKDPLDTEGVASLGKERSGSFKLAKRLLSTGMVKTQSVPDISKVSSDVSRKCLMVQLKELLNMDLDQVTAWFSDESKLDVIKVLTELQKLYNAYSPEDSDTSSTPSKSLKPFANGKRLSTEPSNKDSGPSKNSFWDHIKTAVRLNSNPLFLMVCLCRAVHFVTFIPVMTTVVDFVMDKGLQEQDGKWAIAAISLGDLLGRLCLGWVTDHGFMSLPRYMLVVMVVQGASTASLPMMHGKAALFSNLAVFGMLQGSLFIRHPVLVSKYLASHEQSIAMGCINFFSGFLGFGLPYYIGYFRDTVGSYDYIFYINGAFGTTVGLLWLLEPYFRKIIAARAEDTQESV